MELVVLQRGGEEDAAAVELGVFERQSVGGLAPEGKPDQEFGHLSAVDILDQ